MHNTLVAWESKIVNISYCIVFYFVTFINCLPIYRNPFFLFLRWTVSHLVQVSCSVHWPWKDTLISQTFSPSLFRGVVWELADLACFKKAAGLLGWFLCTPAVGSVGVSVTGCVVSPVKGMLWSSNPCNLRVILFEKCCLFKRLLQACTHVHIHTHTNMHARVCARWRGRQRWGCTATHQEGPGPCEAGQPRPGSSPWGFVVCMALPALWACALDCDPWSCGRTSVCCCS